VNSGPPTDAQHHAAAAPRRRRVRLWQVVLLWLVCMSPFAGWGLPTSRYDEFLFGGGAPWEPERYQAARRLEARRTRIGGADTDLDPLARRDRLVELTATQDDRAALLLRYRLYSRQPDEMITFMALQRMDPRRLDFDPRLYQYGGGYIYLIAGALGLAGLLGLLELSTDVGVYLQQPELFARFYVVARLVTLAFGCLALASAVRLAGRIAGRTAGWVALLVLAVAPVFITCALEAKPHLPAAAMLLWATLSAWEYQAGGRRRDALLMGAKTGYALALVPTGLAGLLLWPAVLLARPQEPRRTMRHLALAGALAVGVYSATNPYVLYNGLFNREAFWGNIANSTAMYQVGRFDEGLLRVGDLLIESCGPGALVLGLGGIIWFCRRLRLRSAVLVLPAAATLLLCIGIGAGKPAEFARFLLLPTAVLALGTAAAAGRLAQRHLGWGILAGLAALGLMRSPAYLRSFYVDVRFEHESRHQAARYLAQQVAPGEAIGVVQEPAPYAVPPLDFRQARVLLLPGAPAALPPQLLPDWLVLTADDAGVHAEAWWQRHYRPAARFAAERGLLSRISWASKPVFVYRRAGPGRK